MAGDWIKFEKATLDKPEVCQIADAADIDLDAVIGKLLRVWSWFDEHTPDGNAPSVSKRLLDRLVGVKNFCDYMVAAGWLIDHEGVLTIPNFERHNGKTAKTRLLTNRRVANHYANANAETNANPNAGSVSKPLTKEDIDIDKDQDQKLSSKPEKKSRKPAEKKPALDVQLPHWLPKQEWDDYVQMRKDKKKPMTESIAVRIIKKLETMGLAGHSVKASLENSIVNCWTDVYEPKGEFNGSGQIAGAGRQGRLSAVDQVRQQNDAAEARRRAERSAAAPTVELPPEAFGDFDAEFASIDDADGKIVGSHERPVRA